MDFKVLPSIDIKSRYFQDSVLKYNAAVGVQISSQRCDTVLVQERESRFQAIICCLVIVVMANCKALILTCRY